MGTNLACRGQCGPVLELKIEDLNPNELAVLRFLAGDGKRRAFRISEIMEGLGWHEPSRLKGNSRVRNSMRRLVRARWVEHVNQLGDGKYQAIVPYPRPISIHELRMAALDDRIYELKRSDCTFYNVCLEQAIEDSWEGFSCSECTCYRAPDQYQKEMDLIRLRALDMAAEMMEREGGPCRVRGVKPGADAKRTLRAQRDREAMLQTKKDLASFYTTLVEQDEELVPLVWPEV